MINKTLVSSALVLALVGIFPAPAVAQDYSQNSSQSAAYSRQQLDQLLAPVALYPDALLAQVLMAATYPLEVVQAARWVAQPGNAGLRGSALEQALQNQTWDASVKSLAPFPSVLKQMNEQLEWTEKLGDAFLAQQQDVMASVQRLRRQAHDAGNLRSSSQQTVSSQGETIIIEPASPQVVYVPVYQPAVVYGAWPYPSYAPYYFPPPPGAAFVSGFFWGAGVAASQALFGWGNFNWGHGNININVNRYNIINHTQIINNQWQHDPAHRGGVPYNDPLVRQRYGDQGGRSPMAAANRNDFRGFNPPPRGGNDGWGGGAMPRDNPVPNDRPRGGDFQPLDNRDFNDRHPQPNAFDGFGRGDDARQAAQRGQDSRNRDDFSQMNRGEGGFRDGGDAFRGGGEKRGGGDFGGHGRFR